MYQNFFFNITVSQLQSHLRPKELLHPPALRPQELRLLQIRIDYNNPVIIKIRDDHAAPRREAHPAR